MVFVQSAIILCGTVALFVIRRYPERPTTFSAALYLSHLLLGWLFFVLCFSVFQSMIQSLQEHVGIVLTGEPEENYDDTYFLVSGILMNIWFGIVFLLNILISLVQGRLRRGNADETHQ